MAGVTIVIPVRNRAQYLPRLFRSLSALTYEELEVVLVDNASTDQSLSLCRSFAEEAPFVVTVLQEPRPGACCARNCGLRYCKTEWVYFFDSDDELTSTFLEELMPHAAQADVVAFPTMQEQGGVRRQRAFRPSERAGVQILSLSLSTQAMLFRTDFLRRIGGWDESLAIWQDWELGIRVLLHKARIQWLTRHAYHTIYVHEDSITGPSMASRADAIRHAVEVVASELQDTVDRRALYYRCCILDGMLRREGARPLRLDVGVGGFSRFVARLLEGYTAVGGRGAWRLALLLVTV